MLSNKYVQLSLLSLFYFSLHLFYLWQIPIFGDETLFTGWSLAINRDIHQLFLPVSTGIAPLYSWIVALFVSLFSNQFAAGRWVSMIAGFILMIVMYFTLRYVLKIKFSFFLTLLYVVLPILLVYASLALLDSLMVLFIFISVLYSGQFLQQTKKGSSLLYILSSTAALMTKTIAFISYPAFIVGNVLVNKKIDRQTLKLIILSLCSISVVLIVFIPFRAKTSSFLSDYVLISANFSTVFTLFKKNAWLTKYWLTAYYSLLFLLCSLSGFIISLLTGNKIKKYFAVVFVIYFFAILLTDKLYFPRHTLVFAPFLLLMTAVCIDWIAKFSKKAALGLILILLLITFNDVKIIIDHPRDNTVLAKEDIFQFYEDWTSGKEIPTVAAYLDNEVDKYGRIMIWDDSTKFYSSVLPIYLRNKKNIDIKILPNTIEEMSKELYSKTLRNYVIVNRPLPYTIPSRLRKQFTVSSRHITEVVLIDQDFLTK